MRSRMNTVSALRTQAALYGDTVRSLGPWLVLAIPFWWFVARRAYREELKRQRRLDLGPILKSERGKR